MSAHGEQEAMGHLGRRLLRQIDHKMDCLTDRLLTQLDYNISAIGHAMSQILGQQMVILSDGILARLASAARVNTEEGNEYDQLDEKDTTFQSIKSTTKRSLHTGESALATSGRSAKRRRVDERRRGSEELSSLATNLTGDIVGHGLLLPKMLVLPHTRRPTARNVLVFSGPSHCYAPSPLDDETYESGASRFRWGRLHDLIPNMWEYYRMLREMYRTIDLIHD